MAAELGGSAWAWLGDMELDDVLLGLGAAGIFGSASPLAIGFLVNSAHCAEKAKDGRVQPIVTTMFHEKIAFIDGFFGGAFFPVLDRFERGKTTLVDLAEFERACGLQDDLTGWIDSVVRARPSVLHLLLSGPLLGRGRELCDALEKKVLGTQSAELGAKPRIIFWAYAGNFNLVNSSETDKSSLRALTMKHAPHVTMYETTLKAGAWLCDQPQMFWSSACPTPWSVEDALKNSTGFDVSTDLQGADGFFEAFTPSRGLKWIFERLAETECGEAVMPEGSTVDGSDSSLVSKLLRELEVRDLLFSLKMVSPDNASLAKVREALPVSQADLEAAYKQVTDQIESMGGNYARLPSELISAAQAYAELYRGSHGNFLESGCTDFFPEGPRLDKRAILRCLVHGRLNGGASADVLVLLALLLGLHEADAAGVAQDLHTLPAATLACFRVAPSTWSPDVRSVSLEPSVQMTAEVRVALAPLVEQVAAAIVRGAVQLRATAGRRAAPWGSRRTAAPPG